MLITFILFKTYFCNLTFSYYILHPSLCYRVLSVYKTFIVRSWVYQYCNITTGSPLRLGRLQQLVFRFTSGPVESKLERAYAMLICHPFADALTAGGREFCWRSTSRLEASDIGSLQPYLGTMFERQRPSADRTSLFRCTTPSRRFLADGVRRLHGPGRDTPSCLPVTFLAA